ncbi:hypothetical protein [Streptomyces sp. NPDC060035]
MDLGVKIGVAVTIIAVAGLAPAGRQVVQGAGTVDRARQTARIG